MGEVVEFPRRGRQPGAAEAEFSIKDVADASGLPQPVIAQLVPRTWTAAGWMYTAEQMQNAIDQANGFRSRDDATDGSAGSEGGGGEDGGCGTDRPEELGDMSLPQRAADARLHRPRSDRRGPNPNER